MTNRPVTIITGASSGIGRETSIQLSELGHRLVLVGRNRDALKKTITAFSDDAIRNDLAMIHPADISDLTQCDGVVHAAIERWGRVDVLVNNAGMAESAPIDQITEERLVRSFAVNTFGPARLIAACWPHFQSQRCGCVVNITTMATSDPFPGLSVYAAAKISMESLMRSILNERGKAKITAYTIAPGAVETPMLRGLFSEDQLPQSKTLDPAEVAEVVVSCISGRRPDDIGTVIRLNSP